MERGSRAVKNGAADEQREDAADWGLRGERREGRVHHGGRNTEYGARSGGHDRNEARLQPTGRGSDSAQAPD